jgi:hypothetical protein
VPEGQAATGVSTPPPTSSEQTSINLICIKIIWMGASEKKRKIASMDAPFHDIAVFPEPEHPKGRKGLTISRAWEQMHGPDDAGLLILDGDVAIDPVDLNTMVQHVASDREAVWTAPVKLWPKSTHLASWVWGHRKPPPAGMTSQDDVIRLWQTDVDDPRWWTFNFTYIPRSLVKYAQKAGLETWHYPNVDKNFHELATELKYQVKVVRGDCHPRHINF